MISDWMTSFRRWQKLIAASTATAAPSRLPLPCEEAGALPALGARVFLRSAICIGP